MARPMFAGYQQGRSGLWLRQTDAINTLAGIGGDLNDPDAVEKAAASDPALRRKLGSLFSLYYSLWNNVVGYGSAEKPLGTPTHRFLRQAVKQSTIDRIIVLTRAHQLRHVARRVIVEGKQKGWNVVHKKHSDPNFKPTPDIIRRCNQVEDFLESPNPEVHPTGLRDFFSKALRGMLVIDRVAMVMVKDGRGRPRSFHLLPPDDIKPRMEVLLSFMDLYGTKSEDATANKIFEKFGVDVTDAAYIQEIDGKIYGAWTSDEMSILMENPSDEINRYGYGTSPLEESLEVTTLLMQGLAYNKTAFTSNWPEAMLFLHGEIDDLGLESFKKQIYAEAGQAGQMRLPIMSTGSDATQSNKAELVKLRDTLRDMQFLQLLRFSIALKCAAFRMHPSTINFTADMGKDRALIANSDDQEQAIAMAEEEGFHSILDSISYWLTRTLVKPWFDDLELIFNVTDQESAEAEAELWTARTSSTHLVDEARAAMGLPSLEEVTDGRVTGEFMNAQGFEQAQQMKQQAEMQNMESQMGVPPGRMGDAATAMMQGGQQAQQQDGFGGMEGGGPTQLPSFQPAPPKPAAGGRPMPGGGGPAPKKPMAKSLKITVVDEDGDETQRYSDDLEGAEDE